MIMIIISTSETSYCHTSLSVSELLWMEVLLAVPPRLMLELAPVPLPWLAQVAGQPQVLGAGLQEEGLLLSLDPGDGRVVLAELVVVRLQDVVTILRVAKFKLGWLNFVSYTKYYYSRGNFKGISI